MTETLQSWLAHTLPGWETNFNTRVVQWEQTAEAGLWAFSSLRSYLPALPWACSVQHSSSLAHRLFTRLSMSQHRDSFVETLTTCYQNKLHSSTTLLIFFLTVTCHTRLDFLWLTLVVDSTRWARVSHVRLQVSQLCTPGCRIKNIIHPHVDNSRQSVFYSPLEPSNHFLVVFRLFRKYAEQYLIWSTPYSLQGGPIRDLEFKTFLKKAP